MNTKKQKIIFIIFSTFFFIFFPLQMSSIATPYGIYFLLSYIVYWAFWLIPWIYILHSKKYIKKWILFMILFILNILIIWGFFILAEKQATINRQEMKERMIEIKKHYEKSKLESE